MELVFQADALGNGQERRSTLKEREENDRRTLSQSPCIISQAMS